MNTTLFRRLVAVCRDRLFRPRPAQKRPRPKPREPRDRPERRSQARLAPLCPVCEGRPLRGGSGGLLFSLFRAPCTCGCGKAEIYFCCPVCCGAGRVTAALVADRQARGEPAITEYRLAGRVN
jgi:hypothetical protein